MPRTSFKSARIATKKIAAKFNPYYLNKRSSLHARIRNLLQSLRPMNTGHALVRLGEGADGGYLVPDDLAGIRYCFSPGVSNLVMFERQIYDAYGIKSFLCDAAVDRPDAEFPFEFDKKFVGAFNDEQFMTMDAWYHRYLTEGEAADLLLQMDIEGHEYATLLSTPDAMLARFRIIAIEVHHLFKMLDYVTFPIIEAMFRKVLATHVCVHAHPNNNQGSVRAGDLDIPDVMEFAFLRRDRVKHLTPVTTFPHALDRDVDDERPSLVLPKCWYC